MGPDQCTRADFWLKVKQVRFSTILLYELLQLESGVSCCGSSLLKFQTPCGAKYYCAAPEVPAGVSSLWAGGGREAVEKSLLEG